MFDALRTHTLRFLRVPHDPEPPTGAPGSVRVFRGGRNFYKLRLLRWSLTQAGALAGILVTLYFFTELRRGIETVVKTPSTLTPAKPAPPKAAATTAPAPAVDEAAPAAATEKTKTAPAKRKGSRGLTRLAERWPAWLFPVFLFFEFVGIVLFLAQIPITYAMVRLDFELRWYIVTDRSLRIRSGLTTVQESTMSFANVQQVVVNQGPLQRYLGLADVRVQSAGGGGDQHESKAGDSLHTGVFHGVDNAHEIRDLVLARLRQFRESGLGDPDEPAAASAAIVGTADPAGTSADSAALIAARELLHEARAMRAALT